ncbi:MAG: nucleotide exchange factor GrpE [Deltaproteobacteria bacterium]|nr:nucleotide exchange factor GrpE [Deltaproteobacteria bacterium]
MSEHEKNQEHETTGVSMSENDENIEMVDDDQAMEAEVEVMDPQQQVAQLTEEMAREREKYLRALADLDNLRKRSRRDVEEARVKGQMSVLEELLPALDSIDMALKSIEPNDANQAVYDGMLMVHKQFLTSMERFHLKRVQSLGQKFDPSMHEAVSYVPSPDHDTGAIIDEMRSGYTLGERLLRAAMVVVSSGRPPETADATGQNVDGAGEVDAERVQETGESADTASKDGN